MEERYFSREKVYKNVTPETQYNLMCGR